MASISIPTKKNGLEKSGYLEEPGAETAMLNSPENPGFLRKYGGMLMAFLASVFFSTSFFFINVLVKDGMPPISCAVLFNFGILFPCLIAIAVNEKGPGAEKRDSVLEGFWPINKTTLIILIFIGCLQGISVLCRSFALAYIPFGDMAVIVFSSPVVTTVLAHFLVGEPLSWIFILIALYTLVGVGLITKPPFITGSESYSTNTIIGSGLAVGALVALSLIFTVLRKIKHVHPLIQTTFLGGCGLLITFPTFLIMEEPSSIIPSSVGDAAMILGLVCAFLAITFNNVALQLETAGLVALVRSFDVIFAFLFQFVFMGVAPDMFSTIGGTIVVTAVMFSGVQKWWQERTNNRRNRFHSVAVNPKQ